MLLAEVDFDLYTGHTHAATDLHAAAAEIAKAMEFSLAKANVNYSLYSMAATILGAEGDIATIDSLFTEALARDGNYSIYLDYALALAASHDPRAEALFKEAIAAEGEGAPDARSQYAEWLLRQGRNSDVVSLTDSGDAGLAYLSFLRGVALERLGRLEEASKAYAVYTPYAQAIPVSPDFAIPRSELQKAAGIQFGTAGGSPPSQFSTQSSVIPKALNDSQAIQGLYYLLHGEAHGQSAGGIRAEGWVVRNRVLRGSAGPGNGCPYIQEDFSAALGDRYKSIMCQGNGAQFNGMIPCLSWCSNPSYACPFSYSAPEWQAAVNVYYGLEPDPVASYCPRGITNWGGSYCAAGTRCGGDTNTYLLFGPLFNFGTSGNCPANPPACPAPGIGKLCATTASANCFYLQPTWGQGPIYSGWVAAGSQYAGQYFPYGTYYYSTKTLQRAHVEGASYLMTYLVLWHWTGQWQVAAISQGLGANDVTFAVPSSWPASYKYFMWEVYAVQGTGSFFIGVSNP